MYDVKIEGVQGLSEKIAELESAKGGSVDLSAYAKTENVNKLIDEIKSAIPTIDLTEYAKSTGLTNGPTKTMNNKISNIAKDVIATLLPENVLIIVFNGL